MLTLSCNCAMATAALFALSLFGLTRCEGQENSASSIAKPELILQTAHTGEAGSLAFSPDKRLLASGGVDEITLWEVSTSRQLRTLRSGTSASSLDPLTNRFVLAFSANGKFLAQYGRGKVVIWEVQSGTVFRTIQVKDVAAAADAAASLSFLAGDLRGRMEFSPDGRLLALPGTTLTLWDVSTGEKIRSFPRCPAFAFSGTRQLLMLNFSRKGPIRAAFTDIDTGREIHGVDLGDRDFAVGGVSIVHSPDGRWLAISIGWKNISQWDITSGNETKLLPLSGNPLDTPQAEFSPDGRIAALNSESGVRIVDLATQRVLHTLELPGHSSQPNGPAMAMAADFSADGRLFASAEYGGRLSVWDTTTWTKIADLYNYANKSSYLAFEPDGKHLVSGWTRWDLESGGGTAVFPNSANSWDFIASSAELLADRGGKGGTILVRDRVTGNVLHTLSVQSDVIPRGTAISPNGQLLATTYVANVLSKFSIIPEFSKDQRRQMKDAVREYEKGKLTYSEYWERSNQAPPAVQDEITREVVIWDLASERQVQTLPLALGTSTSAEGGTAQFTSDGKYLLYGGYVGSIQAWDVKSWKEISRTTLGINDPRGIYSANSNVSNYIRSIDVSRNGSLIAVATSRKKTEVDPTWQQLQTPQMVKRGKLRPPEITFSGPIEVFDFKTGLRVADLPGHAGSAVCVAFSADGKTLASGGGNGEIKVWDVAGQRLIRTLANGASAPVALAFSPDGSILVSNTEEGSVDLWDLEEGQKLVSMVSLGDGNEWLQVTQNSAILTVRPRHGERSCGDSVVILSMSHRWKCSSTSISILASCPIS